jgi:hypothetical protein
MGKPALNHFVAGAGQSLFLARQVEVGLDHHPDELSEGDLGFPAKIAASFARVAHQEIHFVGRK